ILLPVKKAASSPDGSPSSRDASCLAERCPPQAQGPCRILPGTAAASAQPLLSSCHNGRALSRGTPPGCGHAPDGPSSTLPALRAPGHPQSPREWNSEPRPRLGAKHCRHHVRQEPWRGRGQAHHTKDAASESTCSMKPNSRARLQNQIKSLKRPFLLFRVNPGRKKYPRDLEMSFWPHTLDVP
uniref:Uncharacterized protein n=1 Tax=Strix occidentalis caurina TaxID=311401 RepID=A0A8D0ET75_STROC